MAFVVPRLKFPGRVALLGVAGLSCRAYRADLRAGLCMGVCALLLLGSVARAQTPQAESIPPPGEQSTHYDSKARAGKKDIISTLEEVGHFETLIKAANAAGFTQMLRTRAPLTMFVPTDEAFAKLPASKLDRWMKDPQELKQILRYHMIKAYVPAKQMIRLKSVLTMSGAIMRIDGTSGIKANGVPVTRSDILAANGVLHAIDTVLEPIDRSPKKIDRKKPAPEPEDGSKSDGNQS
jgi:uncharacterized surface protein with fasciclin (FAS1) repeats